MAGSLKTASERNLNACLCLFSSPYCVCICVKFCAYAVGDCCSHYGWSAWKAERQ